jgi:hypothetical protein
MTATAVTPLQVADEEFIVASLIERCPKTMMIRELMQNALEAARLAPEEQRLVEFSAALFDGTPKLVIWNTGPGLDSQELLHICDLASTIGKEMSLTGNFGMGAKVASLPSNQLGMRYRSCKNGCVSEVILCKRDGVYGVLRRLNRETGEHQEVADVTTLAALDNRPLNYDWTEVMLHGNDPEQDTVRDPYNGDPAQDTQWLATYLYHRFYRLPNGVKVTLLKGTNKLDSNRQFETIAQRVPRFFERSETVPLPNGIKVHYLFDAPYEDSGHNKSIRGAIASAVSTCAIVYKDEMYDLHRGKRWTLDAPIFGISFGARHISIHIELPDNAPVVPEAYRRFLQHKGGEQEPVQSLHFADMVREHRPQWLIDLIRSFSPEASSNDEIREELQKLLNHLRVRRVSPKITNSGPTTVDPGMGAGSDVGGVAGAIRNGIERSEDTFRQKPTDLSILPTGAKRAELFKNMERAPEIFLLRDDQEIEERELRGRAARYYLDSGYLYVNMQYPAIGEMRAQLELEYPDAHDPDALRSLALQLAERTIILRVGRVVVYALAKQLNKEWNQKAVEIASSPESLSMAADDFLDAMQNARRAIGRALRVKGQPTDQDAVALA